MALNYPATITDTGDAIPTTIASEVSLGTAPLQTKVTSLKNEVSALKARVASLENN